LATESTHDEAVREQTQYINAILASQSRNKIVVGGPGTGKTFLFKELLKSRNKKALTLTFINSLVEDLALDLYGLSEVKTLHGFARGIIARAAKRIDVFPKLSAIVRDDSRLLTGEDVNFDKLFNERDDTNSRLDFYKRRKDYYGYYGYTDLIYAAVRFLEAHKKRIPTYDLLLVDEFQDFNKLEVSLIDLLSTNSATLIAGDDDQALYFFKDASPEYIRTRYADKRLGFEPHTLIYCCRCTRAIVAAFNDVLNSATQRGFLKNRIPKEYKLI
jgi:hypothetical protein